MSKFLTELDARLIKDDRVWVLDKPLVYYSDILQREVTMPEGFETDLASVPRVPLVYEFWGGRAHREGVLHDYLYRKNSIPTVDFYVANDIFLEAMKCRGKGIFVRYPMFWGVAFGGASSYHRKNVEDKL